MANEVTSAALQRLRGVSKSVLAELATRGIIACAGKRGSYKLQESVSNCCAHLREQAAGRGGESGADVRARLGAAQVDLAAEKAKAMRGETLSPAEVERFGPRSCDLSAIACSPSRAGSRTCRRGAGVHRRPRTG